MIIWLASYPRSGNTFFRILLNHMYGIKTYSIHDDPLFENLKGSAQIIGHEKRKIDLNEMIASDEIFWVKTHLLPPDNQPAIYLVRDGRDSIISYAHYILSFDYPSQLTLKRRFKQLIGWNEFNSVLKRLIVTNGGGFGSWSENSKAWLARDAKTVLIKFEDLTKNPIEIIEKSIKALNLQESCKVISNTVPSFGELHQKWPDFFRKGRVGGWQEEMPENLHNLFWQYHGETMKEFGYFKTFSN